MMLELCLNASYLQFQNVVYQQVHGIAMGSPVSVTIANLVMEDIEQYRVINPNLHTKLNGNQLPFLDILLNRQDDGSILPSVFRKSTHTDRYLQFNSHHPQSHKQSLVHTLFSKAESLSFCPLLKSIEELHISIYKLIGEV